MMKCNIDDIKIRVSTKNDIDSFYKLWKICFNDSDNFCDWLFGNRFFPTYSTVLQINNEIVSCMQGVPYIINVRGVQVRGAMLCGVSTAPEHRKKGFMGRLFSYSINQLQQENVSIAVHTPAVLESYYNFQHFPVANALYIEESVKNIKFANCKKFEKLDFTMKNTKILHPIYIEEIANKYSGSIFRTEQDFHRKWADYNSDGGLCYALFDADDTISGYAFLYATETEIICVEAVAINHFYDDLLQSILNLSKTLEKDICKVKLPPNANLKNYDSNIKQKGVAGCVSLENLLKNLDFKSNFKADNEILNINFEITDKIVSNNNGIFNIQGERVVSSTDLDTAFKIDIGYFLQILIGYETLHTLKNKIIIYNEYEYNKLNELLPLYDCFIIDEY